MVNKRKAKGSNLDNLRSLEVKGFKITPRYDSKESTIVLYFTEEPSSSERIAPDVTIMRGRKSGEIVGCKIHGVTRLVMNSMRG